jgi:hypothetical protein
MNRLTTPASVVLLMIALIALVAASACGGGDDDEPVDATSTPTRTPRATGDRSPSTATESAGDQTFETLIDAYLAGVDGKITYRTTSERFGEHPNLLWTNYRLGDRARVDWKNVVENPADDPMITTTVIIAADGSYVCTTSPGIKSCNTRTPEDAQAAIFWLPQVNEAVVALDEGIEGATVSEAEQRTIAGVDATCYDVEVPSRIGEGAPGTEALELCFSPEGQLLLMSRTASFTDPAFPTAKLEITAQEVAETTEADFAPIATPLS